MNFNEAIEHILLFEGGYSFDKNDLGGETNYGISKRAYPYIDILNLTRKEAIKIYKRDYWNNKIPVEISLIHFDTCVNMGVNRANKILQKSIGNISIDGVLGNQTYSSIHKCSKISYARERLVFYVKIIINKPSQIKYINGWFNRVLSQIIK